MAKRVSRKVWTIVFQEDGLTSMLHVAGDAPEPLALFKDSNEADRYRLKIIKNKPKLRKNYKVVTCILSYVEPTPKKYGV